MKQAQNVILISKTLEIYEILIFLYHGSILEWFTIFIPEHYQRGPDKNIYIYIYYM